MILVEGEFKAAALAESGSTALGLCGLTGAARTITEKEGREHILNAELVDLIQLHRPATVVFLGDSDVVFNAQYAAEAAKLRKLLHGSSAYAFVEKVLAVKCPLGGPKGVDDCRKAQGENFITWFNARLAEGLVIPPKSTPGGIFCDLLSREQEAAKIALNETGHEARRTREKLLQSTIRFWDDALIQFDLSRLLENIFDLTKTGVARMVKCAKPEPHDTPPANGKKNETVELQPWDQPVNGAELLNEILRTYQRFMVMPPHAHTLLTICTLHSYIFEIFSFTPYLHITSPEKECGKSTLAELMNHLFHLATTPGGMTAAAMFRRIERTRPTMLLDEWDTLSDETRQAALNILNTGFKYNGVYTICVGDDHEDRDFHTFCPKAIFGLSAAKLPDTTRSRCFAIMLQKKTAGEHVEKLTRKFDATILRRKCLRWANDHREKLSNCDPAMPDGLSARQEDISEPLLVIADACGGTWPRTVREAILHFCGQAANEESDAKHELLKDIQKGFENQSPTDRFPSAALREYRRAFQSQVLRQERR